MFKCSQLRPYGAVPQSAASLRGPRPAAPSSGGPRPFSSTPLPLVGPPPRRSGARESGVPPFGAGLFCRLTPSRLNGGLGALAPAVGGRGPFPDRRPPRSGPLPRPRPPFSLEGSRVQQRQFKIEIQSLSRFPLSRDVRLCLRFQIDERPLMPS